MTIAVTTVANNQSFGAWLTTTNRLANIISQNTVTVDTSSGGSVSTGNSYVNGYFGASYVYVTTGLSGGNVSSNDTLKIISNTTFIGETSNVLIITSNSSQSTLTINTTSTTITTQNITIANNISNVVSVSSNNTHSVLSTNTTLLSLSAQTVSLFLNGSAGSNGQVLTTDGTELYWSTPAPLGVTSVGSGDGLTGGPVTSTGTISVLANNGIIANTTGLFVSPGTGMVVNSTGVHVNTSYYVTVSANNTDSQTFYFPMVNSTSGIWSNGIVSDTKLYFTPSTGDLGATNFNALSDISKKTSITNIAGAYEIVAKLQPVEFTWIESGNRSAGFIAQDLEKVLPNLVHTNKEGLKSINYDGIIAYLVSALQEQQKQIDHLNNLLLKIAE